MIEQVIERGYCIGCGTCAALEPSRYRIELDRCGRYQATIKTVGSHQPTSIATRACPFSTQAPDEDSLSASFIKEAVHHHKLVGRFISCYVGRVADESIYLRSSSGGLGRWILSELLKRGEVDTVLHVAAHRPAAGNFPLYRYEITNRVEDIFRTAKSAYYPVEMSQVLQSVKEKAGRYAITGLPCFIKAVRSSCLLDSELNERLRFCIGLVCGHLKSTFYAEMIGWQLGVPFQDLRGLDFRVKIPGRKANEKGVSAVATGASAPTPARTIQELFATNYGHGFFKYLACDYCDDVLAETADVSIGDAWLPEHMTQGTSIVVVRQHTLAALIEEGAASSQLLLQPISADRVAASQDAGLRHRREGLAYRLWLKESRGEWVPRKRVNPDGKTMTRWERKIQRLRIRLTEASYIHFFASRERNEMSLFVTGMSVHIERYARAYRTKTRGSLVRWILAGALRRIRRWVGTKRNKE